MKIWLLLFDGTFLLSEAEQRPRGSDFPDNARLFQTERTASLGEIVRWMRYGMPDVVWLKEIKDW
jgi:hypothetical protein